jgi:hypothetical protein
MSQPADRIIALLEDLTACLCSEVAEDDSTMCFCIPIPGQFVGQAYLGGAADIAWVRLVTTFPSNIPGQQLNIPAAQVFGTTYLVEMGVMRCWNIKRTNTPTPEQLMAAWRQQMVDLGAMQRALQCCTGKSWDPNQYVVGNYQPIGPDGDMIGGAMSVALQLE